MAKRQALQEISGNICRTDFETSKSYNVNNGSKSKHSGLFEKASNEKFILKHFFHRWTKFVQSKVDCSPFRFGDQLKLEPITVHKSVTPTRRRLYSMIDLEDLRETNVEDECVNDDELTYSPSPTSVFKFRHDEINYDSENISSSHYEKNYDTDKKKAEYQSHEAKKSLMSVVTADLGFDKNDVDDDAEVINRPRKNSDDISIDSTSFHEAVSTMIEQTRKILLKDLYANRQLLDNIRERYCKEEYKHAFRQIDLDTGESKKDYSSKIPMNPLGVQIINESDTPYVAITELSNFQSKMSYWREKYS
jgi:hypothetical protein